MRGEQNRILTKVRCLRRLDLKLEVAREELAQASSRMIELDSLTVVDSKRSANSRPVSFQLSLAPMRMLAGVTFLWINLQ